MNADACPTETTPVPSVTARRIAANRAELFASAIRRLATDLEAAAQRPTDWRAQGILNADRAEAIGAGLRLHEAALSDPDGYWTTRKVANPIVPQLDAIRPETHKPQARPIALRAWADGWDAYAVAIDP